jgi:thioredoxin 1
MTHKVFAFVFLFGTLAFGQFPPPAMEEPAAFDSSDLLADQILRSKVPVVIDFWATWCMPCRMLSPTIEDLKKKYVGKIKVMKINVDVNRRISNYFRVSAIPAVFFVKDKAVVLLLAGLRPREDYEAAIKQVLETGPAPADSAKHKQPSAAPVPSAPVGNQQ